VHTKTFKYRPAARRLLGKVGIIVVDANEEVELVRVRVNRALLAYLQGSCGRFRALLRHLIKVAGEALARA